MRRNMTVASLRRMLDAGELTPREAIMLCRDVDEGLFSHPLHERAMRRAVYAQERIDERSARATTGVPIAMEDSLSIAGAPNALGTAAYDATIVQKLDGYGALIVGAVYGAPLGIAPVGSGMARHAVEARLCAAALGSGVLFSGGGAHFDSGVTALKPSFGTVSRYGLVVAAPSLKQIGIIAPDARDAATMMDAISDFDPFDPAMRRPNCYDYAQDIGKEVDALTVGIVRGANAAPIEAMGCGTARVEMPDKIRITYDAVEGAEAVFTLAVPTAAGAAGAFANLLEKGKAVLDGGIYPGALASRAMIAEQLRAALKTCDALLMPTQGESGVLSAMAAELSGLPCVTRGDVMLIGRMYDEVTLLRLIGALEGGRDAC